MSKPSPHHPHIIPQNSPEKSTQCGDEEDDGDSYWKWDSSEEACEGLTFARRHPPTHAIHLGDKSLSMSLFFSSGGCLFREQRPLVISHQLTWRINGSKLIKGDVVERGRRCCRIINRPICCTNRLLLYGRCDIQFPVTQHNTLALWRRDKGSNLIFIVLLKQCRSVHGKRSHYYYYFIRVGEREEWFRACNQESG